MNVEYGRHRSLKVTIISVPFAHHFIPLWDQLGRIEWSCISIAANYEALSISHSNLRRFRCYII